MGETTGNEASETTYLPKPTSTTTTTPNPLLTNLVPNPKPGFLPEPLPEKNPFQIPGEEDRMNALIGANRHRWPSGMWSHEFNEWILSIPEDPLDVGFTSQLRELQEKAREAESEIQAKKKADEEEIRRKRANASAASLGTSGMVQPSTPTPDGIPTLPTDKPGGKIDTPVPTDEELEKDLKRATGKHNAKVRYENTSVFKGAPMDGQKLWKGTGGDPYQDDFYAANGKAMQGPDAEYARKSGEYVVMGYEVDPYTGGKRPIYVYKEDARSGLVAMGKNRIAAYQKMLGIPATGTDDGSLQGVWEDAIKSAAYKAQAGVKTTVQEEFDDLMSHYAAVKRSRGGGGVGGNGGLEDDPEDSAAADYYMAMMAILGDISGVQG